MADEDKSERETAYLLRSETMRQRLLEAMIRDGGLPLDAVVEKLGIDLSDLSRDD